MALGGSMRRIASRVACREAVDIDRVRIDGRGVAAAGEAKLDSFAMDLADARR